MMRLPILILLQTFKYTKPDATRYVTYYWKTTAETDKVFDYWAHGPVFIPGHRIFTMSSKALDIFPPWLLRKNSTNRIRTILWTTTQATIQEFTTATSVSPTTTATTTVAPSITTFTTTTEVTPLTIGPFIEDVNEGSTDPFSTFLKNYLRILSVKSLPEIPVLVKPFADIVTIMINNGKFDPLGPRIIKHLKNFIYHLRLMIPTPDKIRTQCYQFYNKLSHREYLAMDIKRILIFMDDIYVEAEEEHMQRIFYQTLRFPNNNATADEIAHDLVHEVFFKPMLRIKGTTKGESLIIMLNEFFQNSDPSIFGLRRHYLYPRSIKASIQHPYYNDIGGARKRYETLKNNIENINNIVQDLNVSSSDTSVDYGFREDSSEEEEIDKGNGREKERKKESETEREKEENVDSKETTTNNYIQRSSHMMTSDAFTKHNISYRTGDRNLQKNIINIIDTYEKLKNVFDDAFVKSMKSSQNFRVTEKTILVPNYPLFLTRIIKKKIPYESVISSNGKKDSTPENIITDTFTTTTFTADEKPDMATTPVIQLIDKSNKKQVKNKIKKGETFSVKLSARINKLQKEHLKHKPKLLKSEISPQTKPGHRFKIKKNRPDNTDDDDRSETTEPYEKMFMKLLLGAITKATHRSKGAKRTLNVLRERMTKTTSMGKKYKSAPKQNKNNKTSREPNGKIYVDNISPDKEIQETHDTKHEKKPIGDLLGLKNNKRSKKKQSKYKQDGSEHNELYEKTKYEELMRFKKLKEAMHKKENENDEISSASIDNIFSERLIANFKSDKKNSGENIDSGVSSNKKIETSIESAESDSNESHNKTYYRTPNKAHERIGIDEINLFLDDYETKTDDTDENEEKNVFDKTASTKYIDTDLRKSFLTNTNRENCSLSITTEHTNRENKLKNNIVHDVSRRRDDIDKLNEDDGPETDNEAVLKMNIYKAVKKLLKT